jgi:hypothetical protein
VGHWVWGWVLGSHEGGSYYPCHGYPKPSLRAGTSASARYPDWHAPLERYVSYGVDQAERVVEGIERLKQRIDDFAHMQTEMQASADSQTSMMQDLFSHFDINPDAQILQGFKLGGGVACPSMSPCLSRFIPGFPSYLVTCLVRCTAAVTMSTSMDCFHQLG